MMYSHWRATSWAAPVPSSMRYALGMTSPSRSGFNIYLHPCWRRCAHHSRICWRQRQFVQANHRGAMQWSWSGRKMVLCASVLILDASTHGQRRIPTLCPTYRRHWKAWWGQHTSHQWISSQASGKSRWCRSHSNTQPTWWVTLGSTSSPTCHSGCVMPS